MRAQTPIRLIQLSDCHLMADPHDRLLGVATDVTLDYVLALPIWQQPVDVLLCTGDLSQDDSESSYRHLKAKLQHIDAIKCFVPGNHDAMDVLSQVFVGERLGDQCVVLGNWCFVTLNSQWPGHASGRLVARQLAWLAQRLAEHQDLHVLLALHHHVCPIDVAWIDALALQQPQALQALVGKHPNVKAVLSGHVHHASEQWHDGVCWLTAPSSCFQTDASQGGYFAVSDEQPGVRALLLHEDGEVVTKVHRSDDAPLDFDRKIMRY